MVGLGRPPRNPMGIFMALVIEKVEQLSGNRNLYRRLWNDIELRVMCDVRAGEKPYHPSRLSRFRSRV